MMIGLLVLRVVLGLTLAAHGMQKLSGWFGGYGLDGTGKFFEQLGFVPGKRSAFLAGLAETGAGVLLVLGFATPVAAAAIVATMLVAVVTVHLGKGFFNATGGYELNLVLAAAALSLAFTGPGALSLEAALGLQLAGAAGGVAALVAGVVGGAFQLASRRHPAGAGHAAHAA
jgi:putative oxidoreductase